MCRTAFASVVFAVVLLSGCLRSGFDTTHAASHADDARGDGGDAGRDGRADTVDAAGGDATLDGAGEAPHPPTIDEVAFAPCASERFDVPITVTASDPAGGALTYDFSASAGSFVDIAGPAATFKPAASAPHPCPYELSIVVTSAASGLSATAEIEVHVTAEGDFNGDGDGDGADYTIWSDSFGRSDCCEPQADPCHADADGSCTVDGSDYLIWQTAFGASGCACP